MSQTMILHHGKTSEPQPCIGHSAHLSGAKEMVVNDTPVEKITPPLLCLRWSCALFAIISSGLIHLATSARMAGQMSRPPEPWDPHVIQNPWICYATCLVTLIWGLKGAANLPMRRADFWDMEIASNATCWKVRGNGGCSRGWKPPMPCTSLWSDHFWKSWPSAHFLLPRPRFLRSSATSCWLRWVKFLLPFFKTGWRKFLPQRTYCLSSLVGLHWNGNSHLRELCWPTNGNILTPWTKPTTTGLSTPWTVCKPW